MESIDALRDWWRDRFPVMDERLGIEFRWRIDAIESEVKANRVDAYTKGYDAGFASADDWVAQHEDAMAEHGWVPLPVDADGEPIHVGDVMDEQLPFGGYAAPAPVDTMELYRGASGYGWMVKLDAENRALINPKLLRHHRAPTVEDVLREFVEEFNRDDTELSDGEIIERFAAKLRLAGDE